MEDTHRTSVIITSDHMKSVAKKKLSVQYRNKRGISRYWNRTAGQKERDRPEPRTPNAVQRRRVVGAR